MGADGIFRASLGTEATAYTAVWKKAQRGLGINGFGIMAPGAAQVAAFKEDCGSDARPILGAESLDLHDVACHGVLLMESVFLYVTKKH